MKFQADKHRSERQFQVGDKVYLKLQPYIHKSIATRANPKLAFKYYGPFLILRRIGQVAYELQLPEKSTVHPVFHVSQLKYAIGQQLPTEELPASPENLTNPIEILNRRQVKKGSSLISQVLVRWTDMDAGMATWENENEMKTKFPRAAAWGQAAFEGEGNVTDLTLHRARTQGTAGEGTKSSAAAEGRPARAITLHRRQLDHITLRVVG